jgi:hypothetical protein
VAVVFIFGFGSEVEGEEIPPMRGGEQRVGATSRKFFQLFSGTKKPPVSEAASVFVFQLRVFIRLDGRRVEGDPKRVAGTYSFLEFSPAVAGLEHGGNVRLDKLDNLARTLASAANRANFHLDGGA